MDSSRNRHARGLFDGIASQYDLLAELFSFFQNGRWRRYLVSRLESGPGDTVLDLCTGTAGVAMKLARGSGSRVIGVDLSEGMLRQARRNVGRAGLQSSIGLVMGRAEGLAFADASFDAVAFTYLLRYVDEPEATLTEVVRVLKPGGRLASLEFGLPENGIARGLWYGYTRGVLPFAAGLTSRGWRDVGGFLGPSISRLHREYPVERIREMWLNLGMREVQVKRLSLGGGVVMWGNKGGARQYTRNGLPQVGTNS